MSFNAIKWALKQDAPTYPKIVLANLAQRANEANACWPSYELIAKDTGMSRRHVIRSVKKLLELGLIERKHRFKSHENQSNVYVLKVTKKPALKVVGGGDYESLGGD